MIRKLDTSISDLLAARSMFNSSSGDQVVFLSDWNSSDGLLPSGIDFSMNDDEIRKYHFWTNDHDERRPFSRFMETVFETQLSCEEFLIANTGTAALSVSLQLLRRMGVERAVAITPTYFTVLEKAVGLGMAIEEFPLSLAHKFTFDLNRFDSLLLHERAQLVILTLPYFGTGVMPPRVLLKDIVGICASHGVWLLVDDLYGGMPWERKPLRSYVFDSEPFFPLHSYDRLIYIESISKRLFLNGCKTALLISSPEFVKDAARLSVIEVGSMCSAQIRAFEQLYKPENVAPIANQIIASANTASSRYTQLQIHLRKHAECLLSESSCGYFALVGIPFDGSNEMEFAKKLILEKGLFTVPHSRYLHQCPGWYCFRINLLLPLGEYLSGLSTLEGLLA